MLLIVKMIDVSFVIVLVWLMLVALIELMRSFGGV